MNEKILCVDDDANVLEAYKRKLRKRFHIDAAQGGEEGLQALAKNGPYAVIVADMRMPGMDGIEFLVKSRQHAPKSVRMMLTGNADQRTAMDAVNDGHIFRFLNKPCAPEDFANALEAGLIQYRLITAERELLTKTLSGSISLLTEILSLVNPLAFGRAARLRRIARQICNELRLEDTWEVEIAAMVSQVGCVTVPEATLEKFYGGAPLTDEEREMFQTHPKIGHDLVAKIPRLEGVAEVIAYQEKHFDGSGTPINGKHGEQIPLGARILKLALDFDALICAGRSSEEAVADVRSRKGSYDPSLLRALESALDIEYIIKSVTVEGLEDNMILDEHVVTSSGEVLVARGQEVMPTIRERLKNYSQTVRGVREPIRVRLPLDGVDTPPADTAETSERPLVSNS